MTSRWFHFEDEFLKSIKGEGEGSEVGGRRGIFQLKKIFLGSPEVNISVSC